MILMNGAAVFGNITEQTAQEDRRVLVCEKQEHVHTEDCSALICEDEAHLANEHEDVCYEYGVCGIDEHTHDDSCFQSKEVECNGAAEDTSLAASAQNEPEGDEPVVEEPDLPLTPTPEPSDEVADIDNIRGPSWIEIEKPDVPLTSEADIPEIENVDIPQTGDCSPLAMLSAVILFAAGAIIVIGIRMRKEN